MSVLELPALRPDATPAGLDRVAAEPRGPIVVIGIGNLLLRDDGVGIRVVEALTRMRRAAPTLLPSGTRLVDGGTLGLDLLRQADGARAVVLVDAVDLGEAPGEVLVLDGDRLSAATPAVRATGDDSIGELLAFGRLMGWLPRLVELVGIQVADVGFDLGLSAAVEDALPVAVEATVSAAWRLEAATRADARAGTAATGGGGEA